jgi:hypothetical protein
MATTLVTCYYPLRSKYPSAQYIQWARTFLQLDASIVLFTEPALAPLFRSLKTEAKEKLCIVELPFDELDAWTLWKDQWIQQHELDPEKRIHSPELYAIWAQKAFFVKKAVDLNPFNTDFFFWCDIGAFREGSLNSVVQTSFPNSRFLPTDRILLSSVGPLWADDSLRGPDGIKGDFLHVNRIVGGLWGGGAAGCVRWLAAYRSMLERYFSSNAGASNAGDSNAGAIRRFAGKDQSVMLSAYLEDTTLANIVQCTDVGNEDIWFYLTRLCSSNTDVKYKYDLSYRPITSVSLMGGLGNQMFQIATAYAHAKRSGTRLQLLREKKEPDGRAMYWNSTLSRFSPYLVDSLPHLATAHERAPTVYSALPAETPNGLYLQGFWQSPKYFSEVREELRILYGGSQKVLATIRSKYNELLANRENVVVVHARRTDYLKNDWNKQFHGPLSVAYYTRAIAKMTETVRNPVFLLCSDDPLFWLEVIVHVDALQTSPFHILAGEDDVHTLALLSLFENFIIANSTFSWWAAWLAFAKHVYAPANWFGPAGPQQYEDIYDPSWIRID